MRQEILSWNDVDSLVDHLIGQFGGTFDALLMITRGGVVPGGLIAEAIDIKSVLTAAVEFANVPGLDKTMSWPNFLQFPDESLLAGRRILVIDDIWDNGRTIVSVKSRIEQAGGTAELAVLHYRPQDSMFKELGPNYYAAITDAYIIYPWEMRRGQKPVPVAFVS